MRNKGHALSCRASPLQKTVHRTVFEFTPCRAPSCKGISHSAECDQGLCPLDTHHPLKSVDVNFSMKFVQFFS